MRTQISTLSDTLELDQFFLFLIGPMIQHSVCRMPHIYCFILGSSIATTLDSTTKWKHKENIQHHLVIVWKQEAQLLSVAQGNTIVEISPCL